LETLDQHISHFLNDSDCPGEEQLLNYRFGLLNPEENRQIELHLAHCSMCNDVLDGMMQMDSLPEAKAQSNRIKTLIRKTYFPKKIARIYYLTGIAASILLMIGLFFLFNHKPKLDKEFLAQESKTVQKIPEITEPQKKMELIESKPDISPQKEKIQPEQKHKKHQVVSKAKSEKKELAVAQGSAESPNVMLDKSEEISDTFPLVEPLSFIPAISMEIMVTSQVLDRESGEPLPGVNITVFDKNQGVLSNINGSFQVLVPDSATKLVVSCVGYQSQTFESSELPKTIKLEPSAMALNEVVVISSGFSRKSRPVGYATQMTESRVTKKNQKEDPVLNEINQENFTGAIDLLTEIINQNPEDPKSIEMLAYCYLQTDETSLAKVSLEKARDVYQEQNSESDKLKMKELISFIQNNQSKKAARELRKRF